jgi:hypothetical protein
LIRILKVRVIRKDWNIACGNQSGERFKTNRRLEMDFDTSHERVMNYDKPASLSGKPAVDL